MPSKNSSEYRESSDLDEYEDSPRNEREEFPKEDTPDFSRRLMEWLYRNDHKYGYNDLNDMVREKMPHTAQHTQIYRDKRDERYQGTDEDYLAHHRTTSQLMAPDKTLEASQDMIREQLWEAVDKNDHTYFKEILESISDRDAQLSKLMSENLGFIEQPEGHRPTPDLEFKTTAQLREYVEQMNNLVEYFNNPQNIPNEDIRNAFVYKVEEMNQRLQAAENADRAFEERQSSGRANPWEVWDDFYLKEATDSAQSVNYITRPRDDLFWKMVDNEDQRDTDLMVHHAVLERNKATNQAIALLKTYNPKSEPIGFAASAALTSVYEENLKSDVTQEDHEFYLKHLTDIHHGSEGFAKVLKGQAGFIQSQEYEETPFPQWADQVSNYLETVSDQMQGLDARGEIHQDHHKAVSLLIEGYKEKSDIILNIPITSRDESTERLIDEQSNTLRAIQFLMKPEPEN